MRRTEMWCDPTVEEIYRVRDEMAAKLGDDLHAICEDIRKKEAASRQTLVTRPPRKSAADNAV
jgi:hypothetical protein